MKPNDTERLNFLENRVYDSGYATHIGQGSNPPFDRVTLRLMVHSGPFEKSFPSGTLRGAIDKAMKDPMFSPNNGINSGVQADAKNPCRWCKMHKENNPHARQYQEWCEGRHEEIRREILFRKFERGRYGRSFDNGNCLRGHSGNYHLGIGGIKCRK